MARENTLTLQLGTPRHKMEELVVQQPAKAKKKMLQDNFHQMQSINLSSANEIASLYSNSNIISVEGE